VAGAALGVAVLVVPGLGPVAAAGAVLASTYSAVATASGIIGATGAAMAVMLSDKDVDTFAENDLERQWHKGRTFLAADMRHSALSAQQVRQLLTEHGGRCVDNETPDE
jgi:precorrin-4 methylase